MRDFVCACGKYEGERFKGMICDRCGVKVTTKEVRRQRFGHIELPVAILHPFGESAEELTTVPVLPAAFWHSRAGSELARAYDEFVRAATSGASKAVALGQPGTPEWAPERAKKTLAEKLERLFELLLPVAQFAHEWNLAESLVLAHGLALEHREEES